jgi:pimeloyl-ACP methyl ester carboxylesterase
VTVPKSHIAELRQIAVPVLVVHGRFDRMVPLEQALMLTSYMPQADLVVINRCGHWPPYERPAEYLRHLRAFLAS